jgi:hypothetical protein
MCLERSKVQKFAQSSRTCKLHLWISLFFLATLEVMHCNGYSVYVFLFWELRGLSPNFHIHVSVSDLYILSIGPHISSCRKGRPIVGIYNSLTDT